MKIWIGTGIVVAAGLGAYAFIPSMTQVAPSAPLVDQPPSLVDLTALLSHGLANGERRLIYGVGDGDTAKVNATSFVWTANVKATPPKPAAPAPYIAYGLEEIAPCRVRLTAQTHFGKSEGPKTEYTYDFSQLTAVSVKLHNEGQIKQIADAFGLNAFWVKFEPVSVAPLEYQQVASQFFTSLDLAKVQAAAEQLRQLCSR